MNTNLGQGLAVALAAMTLLPAVQAAPGDIHRTFYRQEVGSFDVKEPGIGFFGVTGQGSTCGPYVPPTDHSGGLYYEQARIYTNLKVGFFEIPGPMGVGPVVACPRQAIRGEPDPAGYQLVISGINLAATLGNIHMDTQLGTQQPVFYQETPIGPTDWDIGVCRWSDAKFTPSSFGFGSKAIKCGDTNSAWISMRDATPRLNTVSSGDVQTDEVDAGFRDDPVYYVSCMTTTISFFDRHTGVTGVRTSTSHDWALVTSHLNGKANIQAAVTNHLVGPAPPGTIGQGMYDESGDNGNPCEAYPDSPLLAKKS
ncbi:MAG TPA: hypothetical protein VM241_02130 [Candidatus Thermoplasmatota archaeon]|nr:hypothetical protein [Candidatus Thermoplasmatota archaeon]